MSRSLNRDADRLAWLRLKGHKFGRYALMRLPIFLRLLAATILTWSCNIRTAHADVIAGSYDMASIRDASTLETRVIEDWHPWGKDTGIRQKLVEITVCEWWPAQKVRLPVTLLAPEKGGPCKNLIVDNAGVQVKAAAATGAKLRLLKEHGVGLALIGMTTIDAMEPVGQLDDGMKEHFLKTKDARYTPAWIWGISDMRALTTALAEKDVFQATKVLATGGSKRGVATASAGIADDRFTAIMSVVAPIIDPPGGPYVNDMKPAAILRENEQFIADVRSGKFQNLTTSAADALLARDQVRADERITTQEARSAGWTEDEMKAACTRAWAVCRTTDHLPALRKRGVEIFYNQGTNDNVSPGMVELGRRFPDMHFYLMPGGQHGGSKETGLLKPVASQPDVEENLYAFALHHFFGTRPMVAAPKVRQHWDKATKRLRVTVTFPDKSEPQKNDLWYAVQRHPDYTFAMEYDTWQSVPMHQSGPATYSGEVTLQDATDTAQFVTVHQHTAGGSTLTISSPLTVIAQ